MAMLNLCEQSFVIAKNVRLASRLASLLVDEKSLLVVSFHACSFTTLGLGHNINCRVQTGDLILTWLLHAKVSAGCTVLCYRSRKQISL